jgi:glycosyltransferase involved in cell wall biosynthesis
MSALRVVHVMEATIGGTRRHLRDVSALQAADGFDVTVVASVEREPAFRADLAELSARGVRVRELPMVRAISPWRDARHVRALAALLRELAPDIVHTHSSKAGVLGRVASLWTGRGKRVHTPHTFAFLFEGMFSPRKRAFFREVERRLARRTHAIVAVSASEAATIRASGIVPPALLHCVPNGIDPAPWLAAEPLGRASLGVPAGAPLALVAGLLNVAKGQDIALALLAEPQCRSLVLLVAGNGAERAALERQAAELGVAERVRFLGWRDDVPRLVRTCDFVLLPSRWEGLPYTVLEAFAGGVPVVATPVDGARELVIDGHTGKLASAIDARALAEATAEMLALSPAERAALGVAGRELVSARHTLRHMVSGLADVYRGVA